MKKLASFAFVAALASSPAWAQLPPIVISNQAYQSLTGATVLPYALDQDEGALAVPLPFSFPFFGQNYTQVFPSINGFLTLGTGCTSGSTCYTNQSFPNAATPNAVIAAVWEDMQIGPATQIRYVSGAGQITIEWFRIIPYSSTTIEATFSITLTSAGTIAIHHGSAVMPTGIRFTTGFENANGTQGANLLPCGSTCTGLDFQPGRLFTIGQPDGTDLMVASVTVANFVAAMDGNLSFTVNSTLQNVGRTAGSNFLWRAYLSIDRQLDVVADGGSQPLDIQVAQGGPESLGAVDGGFTSIGVTGSAATTAPPPTGEYFVLVKVDATDVVAEAAEGNNVSSTLTAFVQGVDLVATSISGPPATGSGNLENVTINFFNRGTVPAGSVGFRVLLSADAFLDPSDFPIFSGTRTVSGGQTIAETVPVVIPLNAPGGDRYFLLQLDPAGNVLEANEQNNVAASSATVAVSRADLIAEQVSFLDPSTGFATTSARFGAPIRAQVRFRNAGGANAANFRVALVLSRDTSLSLLVDSWVCDQLVPLLGPLATQDLQVNCTLPLTNGASVPFGTGPYFLFALVDGSGVVSETSEANNVMMLGPIAITAPGPDLMVSSLTFPASAGAGEAIPVARTLRNLGNAAAAAATYRYFLSPDAVITTGDLPVPMKVGSATVLEGSVTLAAGTSDSRSDLIVLPATVTEGTWFVGCIVDFGGAVAEADELNNTLAAPLAVVVPPFSISTLQLPDGVIGNPYGYQLIAQGGQGLTSWSLTAGALPDGLSLGPNGLISGLPTTALSSMFTVRVSEGQRQATAQLVLRVIPSMMPIEITTTSVPPLITDPSQYYEVTLSAAGGVRPYAWSIVAGTLPPSLTFTSGGTVSGFSQLGLRESATRVTFEVRDSAGARAQRTLVFRVFSPGSLLLQTRSLPDALVGQDYAAQLVVANSDGRPLVTPLLFTHAGVLPDGLSLGTSGALSGRATRAGTFDFSVTAQDAYGRNDTARLTIRVYPARLTLSSQGLPAVLLAGDAVNFIIITSNPAPSAIFTVASGRLPPGVSLQPDGTLAGTISSDAPEGRFDFVVDATDASGASGLGAFTIEVVSKTMGCSSTGGLTPLALLAFVGLVVFRKRRVAGLGLTLAIALTPLAARAQYQVTTTAVAYQPLVTGSVISANTAVSLPFAMPWFDTTFTSVVLSQYGYLAIGGAYPNTSSNQNVPHGNPSMTSPRAYLAPWWDTLTVPLAASSGYRYLLTGAAPQRVVTFEWNAVGANITATRISFQVQLFESSGRIRFLYSSALPGVVSASVGLQKDLGIGIPGLTCGATASCSSAQYPAGQAIEFATAPELEVSARAAPETGYAGAAFPQSATIRNRGGRDVIGVVVRFFLSSDNFLDGADQLIGDSVSNIPAGTEVVVNSTAPIPASATLGPYFLIAQVDPANVVMEPLENNNQGAPLAVTIGAPLADLLPLDVQAAPTAQAGALVATSKVIRNAGNAPAAAFAYGVYLSDNSAVTVSDRLLAGGTVPSLAGLTEATSMDSVLIPGDVSAGTYWLGVCVNYDAVSSQFGVPEITLVNNCVSAATSTAISAGALAITTNLLPAARESIPYGVRLLATGGDGAYVWSVSGGTLPAGMTLSAQGELSGTALGGGSFRFSATVRSAGSSSDASLVLLVNAATSLVIPDQPLPSPQRSRDFEIDLIAVGGLAPYQWRLVPGAALPAGLSLSSSGTISGRASELGPFVFTVEVTDGDGTQAQRELTLTVGGQDPLRITTATLADATLGRNYTQVLEFAGGQPPFTLTLVKFQQQPQGPTEEPGPVLVEWPQGFGLQLEGSGTGPKSLGGTPLRVGLFALGFKVTDAAGAEDSRQLLLEVNAEVPLLISTTSLPDAVIGVPYVGRIESGGEVAQYFLPCIRQPSSPVQFACAPREETAQLPPGLFLMVDGLILGTPSGAPDALFSFLVQARDAQGRQDVRALSLKVVEPRKTQGCSSTSLAPFAWSLLTLLSLLTRRSRRADVDTRR